MILCEVAKITYTPAPKIACTAMKCFIFRMNTGIDFIETPKGRHKGRRGIHHLDGYRMGRFKPQELESRPGWLNATIVRDPIERFRSAFINRIHQFNDILSQEKSRQAAEARGLTPYPGLGHLIDRLEDYLAAAPVLRYHIRPVSFFLGNDMSRFEHVYTLQQTEQFCDLLRERSRVACPSIHANASRPVNAIDLRLSSSQYDKLVGFLQSDYNMLQPWFSPPAYSQLPQTMRV